MSFKRLKTSREAREGSGAVIFTKVDLSNFPRLRRFL